MKVMQPGTKEATTANVPAYNKSPFEQDLKFNEKTSFNLIFSDMPLFFEYAMSPKNTSRKVTTVRKDTIRKVFMNMIPNY